VTLGLLGEKLGVDLRHELRVIW